MPRPLALAACIALGAPLAWGAPQAIVAGPIKAAGAGITVDVVAVGY